MSVSYYAFANRYLDMSDGSGGAWHGGFIWAVIGILLFVILVFAEMSKKKSQSNTTEQLKTGELPNDIYWCPFCKEALRSGISQEKLYCFTCKENIFPLIENPNDRYVKNIDPTILIKALNENDIACHKCGFIKTWGEWDMFHRNVDKGYGYQYRKCPKCSCHFKVD